MDAAERRRNTKASIPYFLGYIFFVFCIVNFITFIAFSITMHGAPENETQCVPLNSSKFPDGFFTLQQLENGGLGIYFMIISYLIMAVVTVCEHYLLPSLQMIAKRQSSVQTGTRWGLLIAAGSSIPELVIGFQSVFVTKGGIGVNTFLGSAVYNLLVICALCASSMKGSLTRWPLVRDCLANAISVVAVIGIISDNKVYWYEAGILLLIAIMYSVVLWFDKHIKDFVQRNGPDETQSLLDDNPHEDQNLDQDDSESVHVFSIPNGLLEWIVWILSLPINSLLFLTIPNCRRQFWKKWFIFTFIMSVVWISAFTYVLVWMLTVVGETLLIPDIVMKFTWLAAGTSILDTVNSVIMGTQGKADNVMSNIVGSNGFDILFLGLPCLIKIWETNNLIEVNTTGMWFTSGSLLISIFFLFVAVSINGWKLDKKLGNMYFICYVICAILYSILYEVGMFGNNPKRLCRD